VGITTVITSSWDIPPKKQSYKLGITTVITSISWDITQEKSSTTMLIYPLRKLELHPQVEVTNHQACGLTGRNKNVRNQSLETKKTVIGS
jgi:hypothetical protein